MKYLYLIKRGPRPEHHKAPFHPVVICDRKRIAEEEADWTGSKATVWVKDGWDKNGHGWLIVRWQGFEIDYGHVVRSFPLPDGSHAGFWRDYETDQNCVKDLFGGALWWSDRAMPAWLSNLGVIYPSDEFTQQWILDCIADSGSWGFERPIPKWWKTPNP